MGNMLARWSEKCRQISEMEEIIDTWLAQDVVEWRSIESPKTMLMKYFEIDPVQLDKERRAVLDEQRKLNEG